MSDKTPSVVVSQPIGLGVEEVFDNCEAYQNHVTGQLVIITLQSGARMRTFERGQWSMAVISYDGAVVATLSPQVPAPDYEGEASQLGWRADPTRWPTEVKSPDVQADCKHTGPPSVFQFVGFRYHTDTREITGADYRSEDGKTLRVENA